MHWIHLTDDEQLSHIITNSQARPQVIFKHSTRCSISALAFQRLKKAEAPQDVDFYYLDILAHRPISNKIAEIFKVHHESPQIIVIKDGECIYDESHLSISMDDIIEQAHAA
jgi:bacillithiol system protein YtxJ